MAGLNAVLRRVRRRFTCWWIHGHRDARPTSLIGLYGVHQPDVDHNGQPTGWDVARQLRAEGWKR